MQFFFKFKLTYNSDCKQNSCVILTVVPWSAHVSKTQELNEVVFHIVWCKRESSDLYKKERDISSLLVADVPGDWRRPRGRPRSSWMRTVRADLYLMNTSMDEAISLPRTGLRGDRWSTALPIMQRFLCRSRLPMKKRQSETKMASHT